MTEDEQRYREFWSPKTFKEAHDLILEPDNWDDYTERTMKDILTPVVIRELQNEEAHAALEIGCGVGRLMKPMANHFDHVCGIDISQEMVDMSKDYLLDCDNCVTTACDGKSIPFRNDYFFLVYSVIVFQHIPYRDMIQSYVTEIKRVLVPGGVCRIQTHKGTSPGRFAQFHGYFYRNADTFAKEFTDAGLNVIEKEEKDQYIWITAQK